MIHLGDITKVSGYTAPPVDCIIGGSPCQDLSVAGRQAGLSGARSGLFMEQIRIVKEMRDADRKRGRAGQFIRPRYMVWENVPGALSSNKGQDFRTVLEEIIKVVEDNPPPIPFLASGLWQTPTTETGGLLPTEFSIRSFGESPSVAVESRLSQILEATPHPKYSLSGIACLGIRRRAQRRGKVLPPELDAALIRQIRRAGLSP